MKRLLTVATCLACLVVAAAAASKTDIMFASTVKTDAPAKPGQASSEAEAVARAMELFLAEALERVRPCTSSLTPSDVRAMLQHDRERDLLGAGDDGQTLASIAGAIGSKYIGSVNVTQMQGQATISVSTINAASAKVVARGTKTIPLNDNAVDALEAFANEMAKSMAQQMPACPPVMDRYQQENQAKRAEKRERTAQAEARVADYAKTIK